MDHATELIAARIRASPKRRAPASVATLDPSSATSASIVGLIGLEAMALAVFVLELVFFTSLPPYVKDNALALGLRNLWCRWIVAAFVAGCAVGLGGMARWPSHTRRAARLACPLLLLCWLPSLLDHRAWEGRELAFLLTTGLLVIGLGPLLKIALATSENLPFGLPSRLAQSTHLRFLYDSRRLARIVVVVATALVAAYFAFYTVRLHHKIQTSILDLGLFDNLFWNAEHGRPFFAPSANSRNLSYLAVHAEFLLYLLLPLYALVPRAETLLVIQAIVVAASAVPLYLIGERRIGHRAAALLTFSYLLYPPLHQPVFYDFHFLTLSPFTILSAAYFLECRRWRSFWVFAVLSMMVREDVALGLVGIGIGLALSRYRPCTGAALALVAAAYTGVTKFIVMRHFGGQSFLWVYKDLIPSNDESFAGVLKTALGNPLYTMTSLFNADKLTYVLHVLVPLAFLCVRMPRMWFMLFPGCMVTLLSTGYRPLVEIRFQYVAHFIPYVYLATIGYLATHRRFGRNARIPLALLALATALTTVQFGAFQRNSFYSGFKKVDFTWTQEEAERLQSLRTVAAMIPPDGSVCASEPEGAHLGNRTFLFALKDDLQDADYILFSFRHLGFGRDRELIRRALSSKEYGLMTRSGEYVVLRRGAAPDANDDLVKRI